MGREDAARAQTTSVFGAENNQSVITTIVHAFGAEPEKIIIRRR